MSIQKHVLNILPTRQRTSRKLNILKEDEPSVEPGTGCSSLGRRPLLGLSGDIVADSSFGSILRFREHNEAQITVAVLEFEINVSTDRRGRGLVSRGTSKSL
jgi:hypothetical protein